MAEAVPDPWRARGGTTAAAPAELSWQRLSRKTKLAPAHGKLRVAKVSEMGQTGWCAELTNAQAG